MVFGPSFDPSFQKAAYRTIAMSLASLALLKSLK